MARPRNHASRRRSSYAAQHPRHLRQLVIPPARPAAPEIWPPHRHRGEPSGRATRGWKAEKRPKGMKLGQTPRTRLPDRCTARSVRQRAVSSAAERGAQATSRAPTLARPRVAYSSRRGVPRDDVTLGGKRGKTGPRKNAEKRKNPWYLWWGGSGSNRRRPDYEAGRSSANLVYLQAISSVCQPVVQ